MVDRLCYGARDGSARLDDYLALSPTLDRGLAIAVLRVVRLPDNQRPFHRHFSSSSIPASARPLQKRDGAGFMRFRGLRGTEMDRKDSLGHKSGPALFSPGDRRRAGGEPSKVREIRLRFPA